MRKAEKLIDGMSLSEIARKYDINLGTIHTRYRFGARTIEEIARPVLGRNRETQALVPLSCADLTVLWTCLRSIYPVLDRECVRQEFQKRFRLAVTTEDQDGALDACAELLTMR